MFLYRHMGAIGVLTAIHLAVVFMDSLGHHRLLGVSTLFRLSQEGNIPALFSALALALAGTIAMMISNRLERQDKGRMHWRVLGFFFLFLAFDEAFKVHERMSYLITYLFPAIPGFQIGVMMYAPIAAFLALAYCKWWWTQRIDIRIIIAVAGACYVAAAIGIEVIEMDMMTVAPSENAPIRGLLFVPEESGEMVAVALFVHAFLRRLAMFGSTALTVFEVQPEHTAKPAKAVASPVIRTA